MDLGIRRASVDAALSPAAVGGGSPAGRMNQDVSGGVEPRRGIGVALLAKKDVL
jgi:hypothetical protein